MTSSPLPDLTVLLPHAHPMILLDAIVVAEDERAVCVVHTRADSPFAAFGRVPILVSVEWVAQAVGAHVGYLGHASGAPVRVGFLIGVREADFLADAVAVGAQIRVEVRRLFGDVDLATYSGTVEADGIVVARASVNVFREAV